VTTTLHGGEAVYSSPPPGSGALLALILNIMDEYRLTNSAVDSINDTILTYHRITEAFKFAFARRGELGDSDFVSVPEVCM
jgi:gamma-glutamyltranspeptidase/glutathione hydrolase/leukotriene-C4 hydrolase